MAILKHVTVIASLATIVCCTAENKSNIDLVGRAEIYLTNTPADAACLRVEVSGMRNVDHVYDLSSKHNPMISLTDLPLGSDMFTALAFGTACDFVNEKSIPTWLSDPVIAVVSLHETAKVTLVMRRASGGADVTIDFGDNDGGVNADGDGGTREVYNASEDFSFEKNPNGTWSYGYISSLGSTLSLYTKKVKDDLGISIWYGNNDAYYLPAVRKNETGHDIVDSVNSITNPAGKMFLHPNSNGEKSVVRWTAPISGTCTISASFTLIDQQAHDVDVHVIHNGSALFDGVVYGYLGVQSYSSSSPVTVSKNDTIDFVVGYGPGGDFWEDTTQVDAVVTVVGVADARGNAGESSSSLLQNPNNGDWYQRFDQSRTWHQARNFCQEQGGYLVTITSQAENDFVYSTFLANSPNNACWLGATDEVCG